jgi:hypothetical protein
MSHAKNNIMAGAKLATLLLGKVGKYEIDYRNHPVEKAAKNYSEWSLHSLLRECHTRQLDTNVDKEDIRQLIEDEGMFAEEAIKTVLEGYLISDDDEKDEGMLGKLYIGTDGLEITLEDLEKGLQVLEDANYLSCDPVTAVHLVDDKKIRLEWHF